MKEKWTKGEWKINESYETMFMIDNNENQPVACVECGCGQDEYGTVIRPNSEEVANAHLIAQAPAMYEMLKTIGMVLDGKTEFAPDEIDTIAIDDLLAKARGKLS